MVNRERDVRRTDINLLREKHGESWSKLDFKWKQMKGAVFTGTKKKMKGTVFTERKHDGICTVTEQWRGQYLWRANSEVQNNPLSHQGPLMVLACLCSLSPPISLQFGFLCSWKCMWVWSIQFWLDFLSVLLQAVSHLFWFMRIVFVVELDSRLSFLFLCSAANSYFEGTGLFKTCFRPMAEEE